MKCIGCDSELAAPAAYAIMHGADMPAGMTPDVTGPGAFMAFAVCLGCFVNPSVRARPLKAHFALPSDVERMVGAAGSSSGISG
jgi:hypothetical protein